MSQRKRSWTDLSSPQRATVVGTGMIQLALAVAAWVDLARRPADQVNGRKGLWAAVIAVNWVGPIAYFVKGRRSS
ncbi:MAG TPA: PLD nuclease N-terminal domain-containing protein [Phototrophicaceae bacterium]|nr:PLD nuclease N-terminal domain-containing protein [Phototrophicaceae bacterium]